MASRTQRTVPPRPRAVAATAAQHSPAPRGLGWFGIAWGARTRILASYIVLLAITTIISMLAIRQTLIIRLDDRIHDVEEQEILELDRLLAVGRDPQTG